MTEIKDIIEFLDKEIVIGSVEDFCQNGLHVEGKQEVTKIAFVVDVTLKTIKQAADEKCDMMVSHHGVIWTPPKVIKGLLGKRLSLLMKNDISVYVAHLPLDIHKRYSHGYLLTELLGLSGISKFGEMGDRKGVFFGFSGSLRKPATLAEFKDSIDKKLATSSQVFNYGAPGASHIAIVSGTGGFAIGEAARKGIDCFVTGDMKYDHILAAKDYGINVILAGHYETEKWGMIRLSQTVTKKFRIPCVFIET